MIAMEIHHPPLLSLTTNDADDIGSIKLGNAMDDEDDIVIQFTNQNNYDPNDSDIEILSDVNCDHLTSDYGRSKSMTELDKTASPASKLQKPDDQKELLMAPNEVILLDSSDECDEDANNVNNNVPLCKVSLRNAEADVSEVLSCDQIRIESASDEITLQESNMRIEAFEIESDEELIMFDFSNFSADDVLKAVENGQLQGKEFHGPNTSGLKIELIDADSSSLQAPRSIGSFVNLCCRACTLSENMKLEATIKFCPKCQKIMIYQCRICKSTFPTWFIICTHLNKFHQVPLHHGDAKSRIRTVTSVPQQKQTKIAPATELDIQKAGICYKCGIMFQSPSNLKMHEETCETSPYFLCKFCGLRTIAKKNMRQHLISQHQHEFDEKELDDILYIAFNGGVQTTGSKHLFIGSCLKCDVRSKLVSSEYDCETCNSPIVYECGDSNCGKSFFLLQELRSHVSTFHLRKICDECLQPMENDQIVMKHVKSCGAPDKIPKYFCSACSYEAYSVHEFVLHLIKAHPMQRIAPLYKCSSCKSKKLYKTLKNFKEHTSHYCSNLRILLSCAHCRYKTHDRKKLRVHLRCNHVELFTGKRLLCRKCGLRWSSIYKLNNHVGQCSGNPSVSEKKATKRRKRRLFNQYARRRKV